MTEQRKQDAIEAQRLIERLAGSITHNTDRNVAGTGLIQANMAQCSAQALVTLLIRKNIISEADVETAHAQAYRARANQLRDGGLIVPAAPQVKPNGAG